MNIPAILQIVTIIVAIVTIILILLNQPQTDSTFGGSNSFSRTRRGGELQIHNLTILMSGVFIVCILLAKVF